MARLVGAQRMVLRAIQDLPTDAAGFVADTQVTQSTKISLKDVRDWLETLADDGFVELAPTMLGISALITAKGKLALPTSNDPPTNHTAVTVPSRSEDFCDPTHEVFLQKDGPWELNLSGRYWIGDGELSYLLSSDHYGEKPFTIQTSVSFEGYTKFKDNGIDTANAGIVIGWSESQQYYGHILLNGRNVSYELVERARPYTHFISDVSKGKAFEVRDHELYQIRIRLAHNQLWVSIDGVTMLLYEGCTFQPGRVGLRPWRSRVTCKSFRVFE